MNPQPINLENVLKRKRFWEKTESNAMNDNKRDFLLTLNEKKMK